MIPWDSPSCYHSSKGNLVVLFIHLIATMARWLGSGGVRFIVAESLILKHELLIVARSRATIEFMHVGPHPRRLNGTWPFEIFLHSCYTPLAHVLRGAGSLMRRLPLL